MKLSDSIQAIRHPRSRQPLAGQRAAARESFRTTQKYARQSLQKLREELSGQNLTKEQRVQVEEAFERFFKQSQAIAKEFRSARPIDSSPYEGSLAKLTQDLHAAIRDIVGPGEESTPGPEVNRTFLGGTGVGTELDVRA